MDLSTTETPEMSPFLVKSKKFKLDNEDGKDDLNLDSPNLSPIKQNLINYF